MDATTMTSEADDLQARERLGFHEIVPGQQPEDSDSQGADWVPEFDLGRQLMARHRRATAQRRRPPQAAQVEPTDGQIESEERRTPKSHGAWLALTDPWSSVVADIVARDIASLCRGEQVYS